MEWQPIETAPMDGTIILLYRPTALVWGKVTIGKYDANAYARKPRPYWEIWFKIGGVKESRDWEPTHWMLLPTPPKTKG